MKAQSCGVGIVGYGPNSASQTFHVPLIGAEPRFTLEVVSTLMPDVVRPLLPGINVVTEVDDVINNSAVQLVVVATPNAWHYEYAKRALEAGKHVVVEKPLCITAKEIDELIALAKSKDLILSQFHNRRWDAGFLTVQKLIADRHCGELAVYEANYDRWAPEVPANWREEKKPGAGALFDLGVHLLDQTIALFGRPQAVSATIKCQRDGAAVDDYFSLELDYGRMQAVLGASFLAASPGPRYKLSGTKGAYVKAGAAIQDPQAGMLTSGMKPGDPGWGEDRPEDYGYFTDGQTRETIPTVPGSYQSFYSGLADAILHDKQPPVPVEDARDIVAIIEAAFRSETEGRRIPAAEIGFAQSKLEVHS